MKIEYNETSMESKIRRRRVISYLYMYMYMYSIIFHRALGCNNPLYLLSHNCLNES